MDVERRPRRLIGTGSALVLAVVLWIVVMPSAQAAPPDNGCPEGFELISVVQAETEGYPLGRVVDEFAGPPPGNDDGYACRRLIGDGVFHGYPGRPDNVYNWIDNRLP